MEEAILKPPNNNRLNIKSTTKLKFKEPIEEEKHKSLFTSNKIEKLTINIKNEPQTTFIKEIISNNLSLIDTPIRKPKQITFSNACSNKQVNNYKVHEPYGSSIIHKKSSSTNENLFKFIVKEKKVIIPKIKPPI